jgi:acyl-homoserine-lactone acylase
MTRFTHAAVAAAVIALCSAGPFAPARPFAAGSTEILWDRYGVPHIYAADRESMFYAHGWAQMRNHADLLLRLYGESRGRAAEYWGGDGNLELDRWVQLNGVPERAKRWYDAQDPQFRKYLDEFARGINEFAAKNPSAIGAEFRVVLPVSGVDVVQHPLRAVHYGYMASRARMTTEVAALLKNQRVAGAGRGAPATNDEERSEFAAGSNTWAIGPAKSASGNAMLLINPHLAWGNTFYRYMQVHLVGPDYDQVGAPQVGFPVAVVGFNRHTGWGRTVNTIDTVDFYKLTVQNDQYVFDGALRPFERETRTLKVRRPDGSLREEQLNIRRTVHGPVVFDENGVTVAMRVAGLDRPKMLEQWFRMGEARSLEEFQSALRIMSVPMWHANYADDQRHIMFVFDGLVPRRRVRDYQYWSGVVPGDTSETLWTDYLSFDELPKSVDPPSGFHQNANEPPWLMTLPQLDRAKFPAYVAPTGAVLPQMRTLRSLRMITEDKKIGYEQLLAKKHSTRMELADRILPDLLTAAGSTDAGRVLARWDRHTDVDSSGAVLFQLFVDRYFSAAAGGFDSKLRVKYDPERPLDSARGLADPAGAAAALAAAADECVQRYGSLDVKWGVVFRFASGNADLPGNGGPGGSGLFRTIAFARRPSADGREDDKYYAASGETIVCAIEFSQDQRAQCLLGYGNATQPGSPHLEDQLPFMVHKKLLPVHREKKDIEAHLELRERF